MEKALRYRAWVGVGLLALLTFGIWAAVFAEERPGVLTVAILNVGQGDSIYIQSPTGVEVLIDGGPNGTVLRELAGVMQLFDREIDALVATHPDADHTGGLVDVFERYEVGVFIEPGVTKNTAVFARLQAEVEEEGAPRVLARRGMSLELGHGAVLHVLYPNYDVSRLSSRDVNNGGVVMQLVYGSSTMLLMADVPKEVERRLMALDGGALKSDILKVGHHGSRTATGLSFVNMVSPAAAVISVGKNSYGHPTNEALGTLAQSGAAILRTDQNGTIIFKSRGGEFIRTQ